MSGREPSTSVEPYSRATSAEVTERWFHRARPSSETKSWHPCDTDVPVVKGSNTLLLPVFISRAVGLVVCHSATIAAHCEA